MSCVRVIHNARVALIRCSPSAPVLQSREIFSNSQLLVNEILAGKTTRFSHVEKWIFLLVSNQSDWLPMTLENYASREY